MRSTTAAVLAAALLSTAAARGQAEAERPWAKGVPPEEQKTALALFRDGNALLKESVFVQAAAKYREALRHWDHPAIHYNLVLALLNLDQPLEVRQHLVQATRYGAEPLDADKFEQAKAYKLLVEKQLARVSVRCDEPGAQVVMDGRELFVAPGRWEDYVRPGPHSIVASKAGFLTNDVTRALPAGELTALDIKLFRASDLTRYKRKWSVGIPWAVVAAGAAVGIAGGGLHFGAAKSFDDFDRAVQGLGGSAPDPSLTSKKSRGEAMQTAAIAAYAVGGAALAAGAVLVYVNRLVPYQESSPLELRKTAEPSLQIVPLVGPGAGGMQAVVRF